MTGAPLAQTAQHTTYFTTIVIITIHLLYSKVTFNSHTTFIEFSHLAAGQGHLKEVQWTVGRLHFLTKGDVIEAKVLH